MTAGSRHEDTHEPGDALDRAIDATLESALHAHTADLRGRVLSRMDEPAEAPAAWWQPLLRPVLLPVAGAVLLAIGVTVTWLHVDDTPARIGSRQPIASVARAPLPLASSATLKGRPATVHVLPSSPPPSFSGPRRTSVPSSSATLKGRPTTVHVLPPSPPPSFSGPRRTSVPAARDRVVAASLLEMDATSAPASSAAASPSKGDDAGPSLPGAPAGDLGDPIQPMPPLRPIVIQPISAAPIVEAPPVSTLAQPVSTLSAGEFSRDPSGPGKSGGVRP